MYGLLRDPYIKTMLDLSREDFSKGLVEELKNRIVTMNLKKIYTLCVEHELEGVVASNLIKHGIIELPNYWLLSYEKEKKRLLLIKEISQSIAESMAKSNIDIVVLKNGGILNDMIDDVVKCPMGDIDTLIRKSDFKRAHQILLNMGFKFKFRSEYEFEDLDKAYRNGSTEYYKYSPSGEKIWVELAWRAFDGRWIRQDLEPDSDKLIDNSYIVNNTYVRVLSPEDNLLQVCVHTSKHSYVRAPGLRLHLDVDRIIHYKEIDWDLFLGKVEELHVKTATYFSLFIPTILFNTPVPKYVLEILSPKNCKHKRILRSIEKAGLLHPKDRKFNKLEFIFFQLSLYDDFHDKIKVLYPSTRWMKEHYDIRRNYHIPYYFFIRGLDLLGIRKKKNR